MGCRASHELYSNYLLKMHNGGDFKDEVAFGVARKAIDQRSPVVVNLFINISDV